MDSFLQQAWRSGAGPLDESTLAASDLLPLNDLHRALQEVVAVLGVNDRTKLRRLLDWHEHDGYVTEGQTASGSELISLLANAESLYAGRAGEDFVRLSFYDHAATFLLRIWVLEEDEDRDAYPGRWGHFDLSASTAHLDLLATRLTGIATEREKSSVYFNRRYAGASDA